MAWPMEIAAIGPAKAKPWRVRTPTSDPVTSHHHFSAVCLSLVLWALWASVPPRRVAITPPAFVKSRDTDAEVPKGCPGTNSTSTSWKPVGYANDRAPPQTCWIRNRVGGHTWEKLSAFQKPRRWLWVTPRFESHCMALLKAQPAIC